MNLDSRVDGKVVSSVAYRCKLRFAATVSCGCGQGAVRMEIEWSDPHGEAAEKGTQPVFLDAVLRQVGAERVVGDTLVLGDRLREIL
jgi:hypothetical protein